MNSKFSLDTIHDANEHWQPARILIHSAIGLGKTIFGSTFDRAIMARTEDGAGNVACKTFPEMVNSYGDMVEAIQMLHGEHPFKSFVIDTADWFEPHVWSKTCAENPVNKKGEPVYSILDHGYGEGYKLADRWWKDILCGLDSLRRTKGMNIILLVHSEIKKFSSPTTDPYNTYGFKLHDNIAAILSEWADMALFIDTDKDIVKPDSKKDPKRATSDGQRVLYTEGRPAFMAKNHYGLPPKIFIGNDKTWGPFHKAMNEVTEGRYQMPQSFYNQTQEAK